MGFDGEEGGEVAAVRAQGGGVARQGGQRGLGLLSLSGGTLVLCGLALLVSDNASDERGDEQDGDGGKGAAQSTVLAVLLPSASSQLLPFRRGLGAGSVEECHFEFGEVWRRRRLPFQGGFQPGAAVQLGGRSAKRFPAVCRGGQVAQDALPGGILIQP